MNAVRGPVALGIVGCGRVSRTFHLPALARLPEARVVAVADSDSQRLRETASEFRVPRQYPDLDELLNDNEIEAVAVCVPVSFHAKLGLSVLEAGKHLFMEKPLAFSSGECLELVQHARDSNLISMVGFNLRRHRLVRKTRQLLEQGRIGAVKLVNSVHTSGSRNSPTVSEWRLKRQTGGGVLMEQAIHHFDLWRFILQDEVSEVFASSLLDDETATVTARMSRGTLIAGTFCEGTAHDNEMLFYGNNGRLRLSNYRFDGLEILPAHGHPGDIGFRLKNLKELLKQSPELVKQFFRGGDFTDSYSSEWRHFLDCIRRNIPAQPSFEDGHRAVEILEAILKSANTKQPVQIEFHHNHHQKKNTRVPGPDS